MFQRLVSLLQICMLSKQNKPLVARFSLLILHRGQSESINKISPSHANWIQLLLDPGHIDHLAYKTKQAQMFTENCIVLIIRKAMHWRQKEVFLMDTRTSSAVWYAGLNNKRMVL